MKLKLVAAISALAIPALTHAEQSGPQPTVPKPTTADAQKVTLSLVIIWTTVQQTTDPKTVEMLTKQAEAALT